MRHSGQGRSRTCGVSLWGFYRALPSPLGIPTQNRRVVKLSINIFLSFQNVRPDTSYNLTISYIYSIIIPGEVESPKRIQKYGHSYFTVSQTIYRTIGRRFRQVSVNLCFFVFSEGGLPMDKYTYLIIGLKALLLMLEVVTIIKN